MENPRPRDLAALLKGARLYCATHRRVRQPHVMYSLIVSKATPGNGAERQIPPPCLGLMSLISALLIRTRIRPIHQDYNTSRLDPMRIPRNVWLRAGVGDVMRRRLGGIHGQAPTSARHNG